MWQNKYLKIEQLKFFQSGEETDLQIKKFNKSQWGENTKKTMPQHKIIDLLKTNGNENILKVTREK